MFIPYTYLIGWSSLNMYYYGVQYGKKANPANLWKSYFTSSKKVSVIRQEHGEPDIIQVRKCFTNALAAKKWEYVVLNRLSVAKKDLWVNITSGSFKDIVSTDEIREAISKALTGKKIPHEVRKKMSESSKKRQRKSISEETKKKISDAKLGMKMGELAKLNHAARMKDNNPFKGKNHSDATKALIGSYHKGVPLSEEHKKKISESGKGKKKSNTSNMKKPKSEEHKKKMAEARKLYWAKKRGEI